MLVDPISVFAVFATIFGSMIGSFLNVVIARVPRGESIVYPGSHCPSCDSAIRPYDNIPVISWIVLGAKCRDCKIPISSLYPAMELLMGAFALLLYRHMFSSVYDYTMGNLLAFFLYFGFLSLLVAQSFIDLKYYIIPDSMSIYAAPFAILGMWLLEYFASDYGISWKESVLGAFFGGGTLAGISLLWLWIRKYEGMGWGDVKLLLLIGAMLGPWPALPFVFLCSACLAVFVTIPVGLWTGRGYKMAIPFGPFLALASIIWLLHSQDILAWWMPDLL